MMNYPISLHGDLQKCLTSPGFTVLVWLQKAMDIMDIKNNYKQGRQVAVPKGTCGLMAKIA